MHEDNNTNQSALELRLKQVTRYVSLGLLGVLALCALLFMYIGSVKQNEQAAISNSQAQADQTKDSTFCSIYPHDEICILSRQISADPTQAVIPKDGTDGRDGKDGSQGDRGEQGPAGKGVTSFLTDEDGNLIVTFTDGTTENAGLVVGQNGIDGANGNGILSAGLDAGNLIIRYTDGTQENVGMVVGPIGETGAAGANGLDGAPGAPGADGINGANGISVIDLTVDSAGYVQVSYSDGQVKPAGRVIVNSIAKLTCESDTLTITMLDGTSVSATVDCTPDNLIP